MNRLTVVSIVATSLLLIGCGENKQTDATKKSEPAKTEVTTKPAKSESVADKATKAVQAVKEGASSAVAKTAEIAKEATKEAKAKATQAVEATKEMATKAVEKGKEVVAKATTTTSKAPAQFTKCAGCHGKDGKMKALGKSEIIAGQPKADLVKKIKEYQAGTRNVTGMGGLMKGQVTGLSDADIDAIATYVSGLK